MPPELLQSDEDLPANHEKQTWCSMQNCSTSCTVFTQAVRVVGVAGVVKAPPQMESSFEVLVPIQGPSPSDKSKPQQPQRGNARRWYRRGVDAVDLSRFRQGGRVRCRRFNDALLNSRGTLRFRSRSADRANNGYNSRHAIDENINIVDSCHPLLHADLAHVSPSSDHQNGDNSFYEDTQGRLPAVTATTVTGSPATEGVPEGTNCDSGGATVSRAAAEAWAAADTWAWTVAAATSAAAAGGTQASGEAERTGGGGAKASALASNDARQRWALSKACSQGSNASGCFLIAIDAVPDGMNRNVLGSCDGVSRVGTPPETPWAGETHCRPITMDSSRLSLLKFASADVRRARRRIHLELKNDRIIAERAIRVALGGAAALVLARIDHGDRAWRIRRQRNVLKEFRARHLAAFRWQELDAKALQQLTRARTRRGLWALRGWVTRKTARLEASAAEGTVVGAAASVAYALVRRRWMRAVMTMLRRNCQARMSLQSRDDLADLHFAHHRVPWTIQIWTKRARNERYFRRNNRLATKSWESSSRRTALLRWILHSLGDEERRRRLSARRKALSYPRISLSNNFTLGVGDDRSIKAEVQRFPEVGDFELLFSSSALSSPAPRSTLPSPLPPAVNQDKPLRVRHRVNPSKSSKVRVRSPVILDGSATVSPIAIDADAEERCRTRSTMFIKIDDAGQGWARSSLSISPVSVQRSSLATPQAKSKIIGPLVRAASVTIKVGEQHVDICDRRVRDDRSENPASRTDGEDYKEVYQEEEKKQARAWSDWKEGVELIQPPQAASGAGGNYQRGAARLAVPSSPPLRTGVELDSLRGVRNEGVDGISSDATTLATPSCRVTGRKCCDGDNRPLKSKKPTSLRHSTGTGHASDVGNITLELNRVERDAEAPVPSRPPSVVQALPLSKTVSPRELNFLSRSFRDKVDEKRPDGRNPPCSEQSTGRDGIIGDIPSKIESVEAPALVEGPSPPLVVLSRVTTTKCDVKLTSPHKNGPCSARDGRPGFPCEGSSTARIPTDVHVSSSLPTVEKCHRPHPLHQIRHFPVIPQCDPEEFICATGAAGGLSPSINSVRERKNQLCTPLSEGAHSAAQPRQARDTVDAVTTSNVPCGEKLIGGLAADATLTQVVRPTASLTLTRNREIDEDYRLFADENDRHPDFGPVTHNNRHNRGKSGEDSFGNGSALGEVRALEHLVDVKGTWAARYRLARDKKTNKHVSIAEDTARESSPNAGTPHAIKLDGSSTRRVKTLSSFPEELSPRGTETSVRVASRLTRVLTEDLAAKSCVVEGVGRLGMPPAGFVFATSEGKGLETPTRGKNEALRTTNGGRKNIYTRKRGSRRDSRWVFRPDEVESYDRDGYDGIVNRKVVQGRRSGQLTKRMVVLSGRCSPNPRCLGKRRTLGERFAESFRCRYLRETCLRDWRHRLASNSAQRRFARDHATRGSCFTKRFSLGKWRRAHAALLVRKTAAKVSRLRQDALPCLVMPATSTSSFLAVVIVALRRWYHRSATSLLVRRSFGAWAARVKGTCAVDKHHRRFIAKRSVSVWRRSTRAISRTRLRFKTIEVRLLQWARRRSLHAWQERRRRQVASLRLVQKYVASLTTISGRRMWRRGGNLSRVYGTFRSWMARAHENVVSRSARRAAVKRSDLRLRACVVALWCARALEIRRQRNSLSTARAHDARRLVTRVLQTSQNRKLDVQASRDATMTGEVHWRRRTGKQCVELLSNWLRSRRRVFHRLDAIRSKRSVLACLYSWQRAARSSRIQQAASNTADIHLRIERLNAALCALAKAALRTVEIAGVMCRSRQHHTRRWNVTAVKTWRAWNLRRGASSELFKAAEALWRAWMLSAGLRALDRVARARKHRREAGDIAELYVLRTCGLNRWRVATAARAHARSRRTMATVHWATALTAKVLGSWEAAAIQYWAESRQEEAAVWHGHQLCKERALKAWMTFTAWSRGKSEPSILD